MAIYVTPHMATQQLTQSFRPYASLDPGVPSWQTSQCPSEIPQSVVMKCFHRGNFFGYCFLEEMFQGDTMTFNWRRKNVMNRITWALEGSWVAFKFANYPCLGIFFCRTTRIHPSCWAEVQDGAVFLREVNWNLGLWATRFTMNGFCSTPQRFNIDTHHDSNTWSCIQFLSWISGGVSKVDLQPKHQISALRCHPFWIFLDVCCCPSNRFSPWPSLFEKPLRGV